MPTDVLPEPADRLVVDESPVAPGPGVSVLVVDSPELAALALARGARVLGFCDAADDHARLPEGVERVTPADDLGPLDLAWARLPRDLEALDGLAGWIAPSGAVLVAGGRTKHMTPTMNPVLARHFASVEASLGRDKSRVLRAGGAGAPRSGGAGGWPRWREVEADGAPLRVAHHGATFASGRLDAGTRLLLGAFDRLPDARHALDWGSGAGVVAAILARRLAALAEPGRVTAVDLSWAAWSSSTATAAANGLDVETAWDDANAVLDASDDLDLVVSNPPFHRGAAKDSSATLEIIDLAAERLVPGGQLWLVFNSHLPYLDRMRRHRGRSEIVARDRAYTVARLLLP